MSDGTVFSAFASLPPSALEAIPVMIPPPGIVPNFEHPVNISPLVIGLSSVAIAISTILFAIRCYDIAVVTLKVRWTDLTCTLGYLFILPEYVGTVYACLDGPLGKHQYEIHLSDILSPAYLIGSGYLNVVFPSPMLLFVKLTFFLMYLEIFSPFIWMRTCCIIGGTLCTLFYLSMTIAFFILATPHPGQSFIAHALDGELYEEIILIVPSAAIGLAFDIYLLILPLIAVAQLNMPLKKKIGTSLLFATGIFAIIGSILGVYFRQSVGGLNDQVWYSLPTQIVTLYEGCFGLICVCMPSIAKVSQKHNLVKKARLLFSRSTRLTSLNPFWRYSRTKKGQWTKDSTTAWSQASESVESVTLNFKIDDVEEQRDNNPSCYVHIGADGPPEIYVTAGQQLTCHQAPLTEETQADRVRRYMSHCNNPNGLTR